MINKKIALSALTIVISLSLMAGATYAYFTDQAVSTNNTFTTGKVEISITDNSTSVPFENKILATNWAPGEETLVEFDVVNDGTLPVFLRLGGLGSWNDPELNELQVVKTTKVERRIGSDWEVMAVNPAGFTDFIYYAPGGVNNNWYSVAPGERAQLRLTVVLDPLAEDIFEDQKFNAAIVAQARQTTTGATWPK